MVLRVFALWLLTLASCIKTPLAPPNPPPGDAGPAPLPACPGCESGACAPPTGAGVEDTVWCSCTTKAGYSRLSYATFPAPVAAWWKLYWNGTDYSLPHQAGYQRFSADGRTMTAQVDFAVAERIDDAVVASSQVLMVDSRQPDPQQDPGRFELSVRSLDLAGNLVLPATTPVEDIRTNTGSERATVAWSPQGTALIWLQFDPTLDEFVVGFARLGDTAALATAPRMLRMQPTTTYYVPRAFHGTGNAYAFVSDRGYLTQFDANGDLCGIGHRKVVEVDPAVYADSWSNALAWSGRVAAVLWTGHDGYQTFDRYTTYLNLIGSDGSAVAGPIRVGNPADNFTVIAHTVAWNGREFAVVYRGGFFGGSEAGALYFARFDETGRRLACDFMLDEPMPSEFLAGPQLLWDGRSWVLSNSRGSAFDESLYHVLHRFTVDDAPCP